MWGGVLVYFKDDHDIELIPDTAKCTKSLECLWPKLSLKLARPTIIGCLYRPPDASYNNSILDIENMLDVCGFVVNDDMVILGQFNPEEAQANSYFMHKICRFNPEKV